tara:strand:+ start:3335 stop:3958 length:624 start_codon:yes stop_codon:yes gene_type:complete
MSAIPIFPSGLVKQYQTPKTFINDIDFSEFVFQKSHTLSANKLRSEGHTNILNNDKLIEVKKFIEKSACDFLDNEMQIEYEEFFITDSWINICEKGGFQGPHNHSNSIISGTLYLKSVKEHPPLFFKRQRVEDGPYISMTEHYKKGNPHTASDLCFPCTQDSMIIFNSHLYHGHDPSPIDAERIGLSWNGLVNFKEGKSYRIRFEKV